MCSWEEFYGFLLYHLNLTLGMILHMLVSPFKLVVASFLNIYLFLASPLGLCCCTWATSSSGEQGLIWLRCVGFSLWWFFLLQMSTKKRCTTWELQVKFYLGQSEDCSLGGSISDSSERLLQSGSGESQYIRFWWRGRSVPWSAQFIKDFLLVVRIWCHYEGI